MRQLAFWLKGHARAVFVVLTLLGGVPLYASGEDPPPAPAASEPAPVWVIWLDEFVTWVRMSVPGV